MIDRKIILVCSDGGHFAQIRELEPLFIKYDYLIVTERSMATLPLSSKLKMKFLKERPGGKNRRIGFFLTIFYNTLKSLTILFSHFPKVIITTGSHTALPLCFLGKLFGVRIVWILSYARINTKAKSANLVYPFADRFIVQWPEMLKHYKKAIFLGGIY